MAGQLKYAVVVNGPDGNPVTITPGQDVPGWAAELINDHAYETADADGEGPPPQSGRGSGKDAWAEYAATLDVEVADDATREDIIAAIEAAGHPVE